MEFDEVNAHISPSETGKYKRRNLFSTIGPRIRSKLFLQTAIKPNWRK